MTWLSALLTAIISALLEWCGKPRTTKVVGGGKGMRDVVAGSIRRELQRELPEDNYGARAREPGTGNSGERDAAP